MGSVCHDLTKPSMNTSVSYLSNKWLARVILCGVLINHLFGTFFLKSNHLGVQTQKENTNYPIAQSQSILEGPRKQKSMIPAVVRDSPAWGCLCYTGPSIPYLEALPCRQEDMEVSQNDTVLDSTSAPSTFPCPC